MAIRHEASGLTHSWVFLEFDPQMTGSTIVSDQRIEDAIATSCTTQEGVIHSVIVNGERVWSTYESYGYDLEATCSEEEIAATQG